MFKRLLRGRDRDDPPPAPSFHQRCERFWAWFASHEAEFHAALRSGDGELDPDMVSAAVAEISPDLAWEFCPGSGERTEGFALSSEGEPLRRLLCEHAVAMAPELARWSFFTSKQPAAGALSVRVGPHDIQLTDMRFGLEFDGQRGVVHITVHHPRFAELPDDVRDQLVFIALDTTLGEDLVARWLGGIDTVVEPGDAERIPLLEVRSSLRALLTEHELDPDQKPHHRWYSIESEPSADQDDLRGDIRIATTCVTALHDAEEAPLLHEMLARAGAAVLYLTLPAEGVPPEDRVARREALLEPLEHKLLEARAGLRIGQAFAADRDHGDFLVFDEARAIELLAAGVAALPEFRGVTLRPLDPQRRSEGRVLS